MQTPWHKLLLQYGTAIAALVVITISALILLTVVGTAIVLSKFSLLIR